MKKTLIIGTALVFVLAVGTAFADEWMVKPFDRPEGAQDTLLSFIDPSSVVIAATEATDAGSAAGGIGADRDSLINTLDPGNISVDEVADVHSGSAAGGMIDEKKDTLLDDIAPESIPN